MSELQRPDDSGLEELTEEERDAGRRDDTEEASVSFLQHIVSDSTDGPDEQSLAARKPDDYFRAAARAAGMGVNEWYRAQGIVSIDREHATKKAEMQPSAITPGTPWWEKAVAAGLVEAQDDDEE